MRRTVHGIAAVLHTTMRGKPVRFAAPGPSPCLDGALIARCGVRVGEVHAVWVEGDRVHWIGRLDEERLTWDEAPAPLAVPVPEPSVRDLIEGGRLVGVPALTQARTEREEGCMALAGWAVTRMELMAPETAPWAGLELNLR